MIHNAIVIEGLYKKFGTTVALNNISFKSVEGVNIILGPKWCRKKHFSKMYNGVV